MLLTHFQAVSTAGLLPRDVWVWIPLQYQQDPAMCFPVIYMHDGQNLFEPEKSYTKVTWGVAETITKLSTWGLIKPAIVVGIDNTENRIGDYLPTRPFDTPEGRVFVEAARQKAPAEFQKVAYTADRYLQLIVKKIKPMIDDSFRTQPETSNTFIIGSSMGGLISLYALVEYPEIFGGAGCFSTHWPAVGDFMESYLREYMPKAGLHQVYYDLGTGNGDAIYPPYQKKIDEIMVQKGYTEGHDWQTRIAPGAIHHERAWRRRFHLALRFFLGRH